MKAALLVLALVALAAAAPTANSKTCVVCEFIVKETESLLAQNKTEAEIMTFVDNLCDHLGKVGAECTAVVNQYLPQIINLLVNKEDPQTVCTQVHACAAKVVEVVVAQPKSGSECAICEFAVKEIESLLANNATDATILTHLEGWCKAIPKIGAECAAVIETYGPMLIQKVQSEDPQAACTLVHLCTSEPVAPKAPELNECTICQFVVGEVESLLEKNSTEAEIMKELDAICSHLGKISGECTAVINQYLPQIIDLLEQKEDPVTVCDQIHLCKPNATKYSPESVAEAWALAKKAALEANVGSAKCTICQWVAGKAEGMLAANSTLAEIESELDHLCKKVPVVGSECASLVNEYLPQIIGMLENKESPDAICEQLDLCPKESVRALIKALQMKIVN